MSRKGVSPHARERGERSRALPAEILVVWAFVALESVAIFATYATTPARELYHVSGSGLGGGAGRVLVYLNWPVALVAIPVLALLAVRLDGRGARVAALVGILASAAVFWPGIVEESDLDAKWANAVAAFGVLVAVALTATEWRTRGVDRLAARPGDGVRLASIAAALVLALPWIAADVGISLDGVPVLGTLYQTGELRTQPGEPVPHPAVHHGYHHGMGGVFLVIAAVVLSRPLVSVASRWIRTVLTAYLAVLFCYGAGNLANDFWLEQVVKRGWTDWQLPNVTTPTASVGWGVLLLAAAALFAVALARDRKTGGPFSATPEAA